MQIANNSVVSIQYTLKNSEGTIIDQSSEDHPLTYLQGHKNIIPGLENALLEKTVGDTLDVSIEPEQAYGTVNPALIQEVPKEHFQGVEALEVGMRFQASTEQGPVPVVVTNVAEDVITVDGNHPLAGQTLNFSVKVEDIREASEEELAQGHLQVEQSGGCCGGGSGEGENAEGGSCGCS
jgi:FKBP-type peptidyl-prolyl cis-trans isomerase SlyD